MLHGAGLFEPEGMDDFVHGRPGGLAVSGHKEVQLDLAAPVGPGVNPVCAIAVFAGHIGDFDSLHREGSGICFITGKNLERAGQETAGVGNVDGKADPVAFKQEVKIRIALSTA